jgi:hypothetical protein
MGQKEKKSNTRGPIYHKSTKSLVNQNPLLQDAVANKRKLSSPQKGPKTNNHAFSNKLITSKFDEHDDVIFFRHSERRTDKVTHLAGVRLLITRLC